VNASGLLLYNPAFGLGAYLRGMGYNSWRALIRFLYEHHEHHWLIEGPRIIT